MTTSPGNSRANTVLKKKVQMADGRGVKRGRSCCVIKETPAVSISKIQQGALWSLETGREWTQCTGLF